MMKSWVIQTAAGDYVDERGRLVERLIRAMKWRTKADLPTRLTFVNHQPLIKEEDFGGNIFYYDAADDEKNTPIAEARLACLGVYTEGANGQTKMINVFMDAPRIK